MKENKCTYNSKKQPTKFTPKKKPIVKKKIKLKNYLIWFLDEDDDDDDDEEEIKNNNNNNIVCF